MFSRTTSTKLHFFKNITADFRRLSQIVIRTFHRRDAKYAEEIPFAQSGDDDWAKTFSSNLRNVFVCRRLPTNKKVNSLRPLRSLLYLFLRVLRVLRGQTVCHHEEHEGHEVWMTVRAKNARVTKIVLRPLRLCGKFLQGFLSVFICVNLRYMAFDAFRKFQDDLASFSSEFSQSSPAFLRKVGLAEM